MHPKSKMTLGKAEKTFNTPEEFLLASQTHQTQYSIDFLDKRLIIYPEVFSPRYGESSRFIAESWDLVPGQTVLDMGTGTGILSICAMLLAKAGKVVSVDINPQACECAKQNVATYGLQEYIDVRQGDLFEPLLAHEKFDRIVFNPPYHDGVPKSSLEYAVYDPNYMTLRSFLQKANNYLNSDGAVILNYSELGNVQYLESMLIEYRYEKKIIARTQDSPKRLLYILKPLKSELVCSSGTEL